MRGIEANKLLLHLARNSEIDADLAMVQQLPHHYTPSFFNRNLYSTATLKGRVFRVFNTIRGERNVQEMVVKLFQKAINSSSQPLMHPHLIRLSRECTPNTLGAIVSDWENPSITGLENHRHELQERDKEKRRNFSLLQPQCLRAHLSAMLQTLPQTMSNIDRLQTLISQLSFHPEQLDAHMDAAEITQGWLNDSNNATHFTLIANMQQLLLSPIERIDHTTLRSIVLGPNPTDSGRGYWQRWLANHPSWRHPSAEKIEILYQKALERDHAIKERLAAQDTHHARNQFLHKTVANELAAAIDALPHGDTLLIRGAFGTRVPSVQRLFQLLQQLPTEILKGLPDFLKKQVLYEEPNRYIAQLVRQWIDQHTTVDSLTPEQRLFLLSLVEDPDKQPPDLLLNRMKQSLPPPLRFLVRWFYTLVRPLWRRGAITTYEDIDHAIPSRKVLEALSLLCSAPGISHDIVVIFCYYTFSLLAFLPRGKVIEILSWVRDNIQRFIDPQLRPSALNDLEKMTESLAERPIESILKPMIDRINEALHVLYKDIVTPGIALPFVQMTGIEYPFLAAPFWLTISHENNGSYSVHIYGSGHSLYHFQHDEKGIKWPRVSGNIPRERISLSFLQRILDHTYRAAYDTAFTSASEDLFGENGTFDTLIEDLDFRRTPETELQSIFLSRDSHLPQEIRSFTRIIDTEWELYQAATTHKDPHLIGLFFHFDALISYCQQFYNCTTENLSFRHHPEAVKVLHPVLRQIEQEFMRHENALSQEEKLCIHTTLRDIHIALSAIGSDGSNPSVVTGVPKSVVTTFRRAMDLFGIEPKSILLHRRTIAWLFGNHIDEAAAYLLGEASKAEGLTLSEVEETAFSDLREQIRTIQTLASAESTFPLQAQTLSAHLGQRLELLSQLPTLAEQIEACEELIQNTHEEWLVWKGIYSRYIHQVKGITGVDTPTKDYLERSVNLLQRKVIRSFEIDRVYSRLSEHPERSKVTTLYTLLDYCRRIDHIHRRAVVLHRTLRKKQNYQACLSVLAELEKRSKSLPKRRSINRVRIALSKLERDYISRIDYAEAHETLNQLAVADNTFHPQVLRLKKHLKAAQKIDQETLPESRFFRVVIQTIRVAFTILNKSTLPVFLYRVFSLIVYLLPSAIRHEIFDGLKKTIQTLSAFLISRLIRYFQWNEPVEVFYEIRTEMNQYANTILQSRTSPSRTARQFCHFTPFDRTHQTDSTIQFMDHNLLFTLRDQAYSREYPGFFIAQHQFPPKLRRYGSYLLLENRSGEQRIILPAADDVSPLSWHIRKQLGVLANPLSHLLPVIRSLLTLPIRKGTRSYYCYSVDNKSRLTTSDPEALAYLLTVEFLQGKISSVIHAAEQLHAVLDATSSVPPDVEMMIWPLMVLPNTLSASIGLGPFNTLFRLRQKIMAKLELKVDGNATPHNNSGLIRMILITALLQDLYARMKHGAEERTPWPLDDLEYEEHLLYLNLHRQVENIVSTDYRPVHWFEARILPPSMAKRYRELYSRYVGEIPIPHDHFFRDCFHTPVTTLTRSYYGSAAATPGDLPMASLGATYFIDSDRIEQSFWQRVHAVFRAHIDAVRNPQLNYTRLRETLNLAETTTPLSQEALQKHFLHHYRTALGLKGSLERNQLLLTLKQHRGGWDLQTRTLIDLLATVAEASTFRDKPLTSMSQPVWWAMRKLAPRHYEAFKWAGLHPLGLIATPIYGLVNHSIWSENLTRAADRLTQLWGTGTNPPISVTLFATPCMIEETGALPTHQLRLCGTLHQVNKRLEGLKVHRVANARHLRIDLFAYLVVPSDIEIDPFYTLDCEYPVSVTTTGLTNANGEALLQIPHPINRMYHEAMDGWMALDPKSYFPDPKLLQTFIQHRESPQTFFDYLHSKVHAYKIVYAYTRPLQKGIIWLLKNPLISVTGGKRAFYPIWAETIHRGAIKGVIAWKEHYSKEEKASINRVADSSSIDFAEWLLDENSRFGRLFNHLKKVIFEKDGALKEGQPIITLLVMLDHFNTGLYQRIEADRKRLLLTLNPSCITNRWRKPITYRELLLCFFTDNFEGIAKEQRFHERQIASLQTAIFRQIAREIRHEQLARLIRKISLLSLGRANPYQVVQEIHDTLDSRFNHARMPIFQRRLLCYEWVNGYITNIKGLKAAIETICDNSYYWVLVRRALIKA